MSKRAAFDWARSVTDLRKLRDNDRLHGWIAAMERWFEARRREAGGEAPPAADGRFE